MKITCLTKDLSKGIQTIQGAISTKTTLPILSNLLLETKEGKVHLAATDLEIGIECSISATILDEGEITIPARKLGEIVRELPEAEIEITVKNHTVNLTCQKTSFKIAGLGKEDFPRISELKEAEKIALRQEDLKEMLRKTSFAISHDETRYALNGVLFVLKEGLLRLVATDGRRLAHIERRWDKLKGVKREFILPSKAVSEVSRILEEGDLLLLITENQVSFCFNDKRLISRLIEGQFPDYSKVIPKKYKERINLGRDNFLFALRRVSVLTSEKSSSVRLDISKNKMLLGAITPELGEAREELDLNYKGADITIAFNPSYILDFLKNEETEEISLDLTDPLSPGVFRPLGKEDYLYVIMPMKI